ncbi:MAG: hypothetical protein KGJ23_02225 [Euryarchaeota archaeon]|nr:hypothetical protein [Euryarchaeota archaeon]MDE1835412.1 hypothetical protein [Euryarchaeota archaeon]MDE1879548.1 hypothetical protein [Euryarchaeota archaeon]MDE2046063.1 hypothetical protein [Thermoplasmata archaeon]
MMMGPGGPPDLSNAELVDFTVESGENRVRLKLKDGSVVEIRVEINQVFRVGNDPVTGLPQYVAISPTFLRIVSCPKELRRAPLKPSSGKDVKNLPGFS